ncbi:CCR4-NOT transcription complex subunit 4-like [Anneissia japonica]|uniref:CCR4-NOT transcription complex subunit 4-like n=1 Tax=Anneissia japonica TaxID=1529436 RepID=UPI00142580B1|nr:CCR4-NOT transcription complex subunit 4-like [Anneissia japonica]
MMNSEDPADCPLCMETLEIDDVNFFPCTCGYQICRFCWHRIRTDENGLCPACRKVYQEHPANFKPLTEEELQRIKNEKKQKDHQRRQKVSENRKHLASVRVVQKNLVFVVGLSSRLADNEVLRKQEYFGKFGKIMKVVVNQNTAYAGQGGPSASAYVTYQKAEDALRAIQAVNNVHVDGRTLKASLGTTKYCSNFLKNMSCPKQDCMYLHELGEGTASFTKEDMQMGKHQEYEQKLIQDMFNQSNNTAAPPQTSTTITVPSTERTRASSLTRTKQSSPPLPTTHHPNSNSKEAWPTLQREAKQSERFSPTEHRSPETVQHNNYAEVIPPDIQQQSSSPGPDELPSFMVAARTSETSQLLNHNSSPPEARSPFTSTRTTSSFFSENGLFGPGSGMPSISSTGNRVPNLPPSQPPALQPAPALSNSLGIHPVAPQDWSEGILSSDAMPVVSSTDWQRAFGFLADTEDNHSEDELDFDPWKESKKGLADLLATEMQLNHQPQNHQPQNPLGLTQPPPGLTQPPPGFGCQPPNHSPFTIPNRQPLGGGSKILNLMQMNHNPLVTSNQAPPGLGQQSQAPGFSNHTFHGPQHNSAQLGHRGHNPVEDLKSWQDGFRALLPNINISFGAANFEQPTDSSGSWVSNENPPGSWTTQDPAILSIAGSNVARDNSSAEEPPHWLQSLQSLTETESNGPTGNSLFPTYFSSQGANWVANGPPPGHHTQVKPSKTTKQHTVTGHL